MNKPTELPQEGAYFGASELERAGGVDPKFLAKVLTDRNLIDDINAVGEPGTSLFHGWREKVQGALNDAYPIFLHLLSGGSDALDKVLYHLTFPKLERQQRTNLALIALQLRAQPRDTPQSKVCSEYAPFLQWAALQKVEPANFVADMAGVTLNACKTEIREMKKARSAAMAAQVETAPIPVTDKALRDVPEQTLAAQKALGEMTSNLPPTSSRSVMPMKATVPGHSRVQSPPVASITITIKGQNDTLGCCRYPLTPAQAKAALAINPKRFTTLPAYLRALHNTLQPPKRGTREGVFRVGKAVIRIQRDGGSPVK